MQSSDQVPAAAASIQNDSGPSIGAEADGGHDGKPLSRLIPHLNGALKKPAKDERLIFIDLNTPPAIGADGKPDWLEPAMARLERYERKVFKAGLTAYRRCIRSVVWEAPGPVIAPARQQANADRVSSGHQPVAVGSKNRGAPELDVSSFDQTVSSPSKNQHAWAPQR